MLKVLSLAKSELYRPKKCRVNAWPQVTRSIREGIQTTWSMPYRFAGNSDHLPSLFAGQVPNLRRS
jgi:hypothetical protein